MNTKISTPIISFVTILSLFVGAIGIPASAQTTTGTKAQVNAATRLTKIISQADTAIAARINDLNKLDTRVQGLKNVSSSEKANLSAEVQTNISGLTSLKAKIDADTDVTTASTDEKSIFGSYRIYALVIPQGYIAASADRVNTISDMLSAIGSKLQTRITNDQSAGKDVASLQAALTDMNAKIVDAKAQANAAQGGIASLVPDQGDKTKLASNTAALKAARIDIKTATADLQAARQDAKTIVQGLKSLEVKASAGASGTTTASQ